jgi:two-component sensor histidine kinase
MEEDGGMDWQKITGFVRPRPLLSVALGVGLFLVALALRLVLSGLEGVPFVTFLPAVVVATLGGGLWAGMLCATAGGIAAWYFFVPPFYSFELMWPAGPISLLLYVLTVALIIAVIEALHGAMEWQQAAQGRTAMLFQELQHRVANNMTLIAAILRLQRQKIAERDGSAFTALEAAELRVETLARLHRRLYRPDTLDTSIGQMLQDLCEDLLKANGRDNIVCTVEAPEVSFDLQRLLPIFFIVTEAVINAIKHAFGDDGPGAIRIVLERTGDGFELTVSDNGHGIEVAQLAMAGGSAAPAASLGEQNGLGSQLVGAFARQLGGQIKTTFSRSGTTVRLRFPA